MPNRSGLPYIDLDDFGVTTSWRRWCRPSMARQHSCVPVMVDHGELLMASPNPSIPEIEEELRLRIGMPVRTVLCTPAEVNAAVAKYYPKEALAAQMAAGVASGTAPASVVTPANKAAKAANDENEEQAPTADKETMKKRRQMGAGLGFMWGFIGLMLCRYVLLSTSRVKSWGLSSNLTLFGVALGLGLVLAAVGFIVGGMIKRA